MPVTVTDLRTAGVESKALYLRGLQSVSSPLYQRLCTPVSMGTKTMECPIASMVGPLTEWTGPRTVEDLQKNAYSITAKKYQQAVGIPRDALEDDNVGVYMAQFETFGQQVAAWPDQQVAAKLQAGETDKCYDGLSFFNTAHPVEPGSGSAATFANMHGTNNPAWYLFDLSKGIKPLVWALRTSPEFVQKWAPDDENVFWKDEYVSGVRARGVADYGFPQFGYKCKATLDAANFQTALLNMQSLVNGKGENLGVSPTLVVIPPALRGAAQSLFERQLVNGGENNIWYKNVEWVVWQRLSNTNQV